MANRIEKQRGALKALCTVVLILALAALVVGIVLIVIGAGKVSDSKGYIALICGGIVLAIVGLIGIAWSIMYFMVAGRIVATNGSIKDGNLGFGTVNMNKCPNCGAAVEAGANNCGSCGASLATKIVCPSCGATNTRGHDKCTACGADLFKAPAKAEEKTEEVSEEKAE